MEQQEENEMQFKEKVVKLDDGEGNTEENTIRVVESSNLQLGQGARIHKTVNIIIQR